MKNFLIYTTIIISLLACNKDFITKEPLALASDETFYANPDDCEFAVNAMYDPLGWEATYCKGMWTIGDLASDDAIGTKQVEAIY